MRASQSGARVICINRMNPGVAFWGCDQQTCHIPSCAGSKTCLGMTNYTLQNAAPAGITEMIYARSPSPPLPSAFLVRFIVTRISGSVALVKISCAEYVRFRIGCASEKRRDEENSTRGSVTKARRRRRTRPREVSSLWRRRSRAVALTVLPTMSEHVPRSILRANLSLRYPSFSE